MPSSTYASCDQPPFSPEILLALAKERSRKIGLSEDYSRFVELLRGRYPWRFQLRPDVLQRDYLRVVDHHLQHLVPRIQRYIGSGAERVLDFGCGSGGSAIALTMSFPNMHCVGTDIDPEEVFVARKRAAVYEVSQHCDFHHVVAGEVLPFPDGSFDLCQCSSVLEYCLPPATRQFCVQEMLRLLRSGGLLFISVPNCLYPFEIHTRKWGWNYFPRLLGAQIVDSSFLEVLRLARPTRVKLYRTPIMQLFRPWSNFCLQKID